MSRRLMSLLVAIVISSFVALNSTSAKQGTEFSDVPNTHWAIGAISWGIEHGVLDGFPNGTFAPEKRVTEAEFLKMIISAYVSLPNQGSNWYDKYYAFASEKKWFVKGLLDQAAADQPILRKNAAIILSSALGIQYADDKTGSTEMAINDLYTRGLSNGKKGKTLEGFMPNDSLTRAEAVQFIYQFANKSGLNSLNGNSQDDEWSKYEDITFTDKNGIITKHELFAQDRGLRIRTYEQEGTTYIQLVGKDGESDPKANDLIYFSSSYQIIDDGTLTWNLITNDTVADPSEAYELLATMFSYDTSYSDNIRKDLAVFAKEIGYQIDWRLNVSYGKLEISSNYDKESHQYYIVSKLSI